MALLRTLLSRLNYANVVATLALMLALGGTATAATVMITGAQIKDGSVTGADVHNETLGTKKIRDGSLLARDFKRGQLRGGVGLPGATGDPGPRGATGATGPNGVMGPQGATGPSGTSRGYSGYSEPFSNFGDPKTVSISLKAGHYIVTGRMSPYNNSSSSFNAPFCTLSPIGGTGTGGDLATVAVPPSAETTISLQGAIMLPVDDGVKMTCPGEPELTYGRAHIQAVKVDSLS